VSFIAHGFFFGGKVADGGEISESSVLSVGGLNKNFV
jgi:hypothetical protein